MYGAEEVADGAVGEVMVIPGGVGAWCDQGMLYDGVVIVVGLVSVALPPSEMVWESKFEW